MEARELRIGNLLTDTNSDLIGVLTGMSQESIDAPYDLEMEFEGMYGQVQIEDTEPIPLTEEWLERLKYDMETFRLSIDKNGLCKVEMCYVATDKEDEWRIIQYIRNVHEWQNLYFALTGEELTINAKVS